MLDVDEDITGVDDDDEELLEDEEEDDPRLVNTSEDNCFKVCVRFLEASANALVSNAGCLLGSHRHLFVVVVVDEVVVDEEFCCWLLLNGVVVVSCWRFVVVVVVDEVVVGCWVLVVVVVGLVLLRNVLLLLLLVERLELVDEEELLVEDEEDNLGVTVDNCNCISIMWSPRRIVKFNGALPDKKSLTWEQKKKNIYIRYNCK
jgi:hypothetical protein